MKRILILVLSSSLLVLPFSACQEKGPVEKAGERVDETIDNIREGEPPLKEKGTFEELGESVDEAADDAR